MIPVVVLTTILIFLYDIWIDAAYRKGFKDGVNEIKNKFNIGIKNEDSRVI